MIDGLLDSAVKGVLEGAPRDAINIIYIKVHKHLLNLRLPN